MPVAKIFSRSPKETQKIASLVAQEVSRTHWKQARVIALEGELGSGKTTFVQGFARALGVKENVLSPTFVLMKVYPVRSKTPKASAVPLTAGRTSNGVYPLTKAQKFKHLVHIDCYRLDSTKDLLHLEFKNIIRDKDAIVLIEWADRVRGLIPPTAFWIKFKHGKKPHERVISKKYGASHFN